MTEIKPRLKPMPKAAMSFLPHHSGDGYSYGGGVIVTLDGLALNLGEGAESANTARQIVRAISSHDKMKEALEALAADDNVPAYIRTLASSALPSS